MKKLTLAALVAGLLTGCDTWFGEAEDPPLPGKRISVLALQRTLTPDEIAQSETIRLPRPIRNTSWPQSAGFANHAMHHLEMSDTPERVWSVDVGRGTASDQPRIAPPIVAEGRVFAMDAEHTVSAFDAETGDLVWERDLADDEEDDDAIVGGIAYEQGRIFATTGFTKVYALDAASGEDAWVRQVTMPIHSAPTVRGGRVFTIAVDNTLYALSAYDGSDLWTFSAISEAASLLGGASPAEDAGVLVAPFSSGELVALRVDNGRVLWSDSLASRRRTDELASLSQIRGNPVIDRGRVLAISHSGILAAIDLRSGRRIWDRDIGGLQTPWVAGSYVFVLTEESQLVSLSANDGRIYWVTELPAFEDEEDREDPILWAGPILASDRLIVTSSTGEALAVSPYTGEVLGRVELSDATSVPPVITDGTLYVLSDDAELSAYR